MGYVVIQLWQIKKGKIMPTKNEIKTVETSVPAFSKGQKFQVEIMQELEKSMNVVDVAFTDYGRKCVVNAIGQLILTCQNQSIKLEDINSILLKQQLQSVGLTELNCAGQPSEAYFDMRKTWVKVVNKETGKEESRLVYNVTIKPQGAGNEKLVRKYGVGLKKGTGLHQAILIHEGDVVTMPQYEGAVITPLKVETKFENINNKVIGVAYVIEKEDGSEDYLIATREGIKPNIIAQIRQNALYKFKVEKTNSKGATYEAVDEDARDKFYTKLDADAEKMNVDELITAYKDYVNPTYTSGGSKESMILRKMKNNALKYYPKEYDNSYIKNAVENMFEEKDESVMEKPKVAKETVDVVAKVEKELTEEPIDATAPADFEVIDANTGEVKEKTTDAPIKTDAPF